jgi:hypothetical protein
MDASPCWLLTDRLAQTAAGGSLWLRWGRGIHHTVWTTPIRGYHTRSVHLPYLLDPMFERYGPGARLWLAEAGDPAFEDAVRMASHHWTTREEWPQPKWVGGEADVRVRLRFALRAAGAGHPAASVADRLMTLSLEDLPSAAHQVEFACAEGRRLGRLPHALCLAAMAVRSAVPDTGDGVRTMDLVSRHYPVYAWYAAMAGACSAADLSATAEAAVRGEVRLAVPPAWKMATVGV